jgi:hypothetical protein
VEEEGILEEWVFWRSGYSGGVGILKSGYSGGVGILEEWVFWRSGYSGGVRSHCSRRSRRLILEEYCT